ncbi:hypothetical protein GF362_04705 [Candidatus Dojkabacteria bacterium]|nr:hypothetical protein [Candidatus Dojkabacteria bacterium]
MEQEINLKKLIVPSILCGLVIASSGCDLDTQEATETMTPTDTPMPTSNPLPESTPTLPPTPIPTESLDAIDHGCAYRDQLPEHILLDTLDQIDPEGDGWDATDEERWDLAIWDYANQVTELWDENCRHSVQNFDLDGDPIEIVTGFEGYRLTDDFVTAIDRSFEIFYQDDSGNPNITIDHGDQTLYLMHADDYILYDEGEIVDGEAVPYRIYLNPLGPWMSAQAATVFDNPNGEIPSYVRVNPDFQADSSEFASLFATEFAQPPVHENLYGDIENQYELTDNESGRLFIENERVPNSFRLIVEEAIQGNSYDEYIANQFAAYGTPTLRAFRAGQYEVQVRPVSRTIYEQISQELQGIAVFEESD